MFIDLNEVTSIDLKRVAQPSFEHLGVKVIGTQMIDFDDIFMDSSENNKTRQIANENIAHIESLKQSFSKGIDLNQYPPCVIPITQETKDKYKTDKPYELVYGWHRTPALRELGLKKYPFTVINTDRKGLYSVRMVENEPLPKLNQQEGDLKAALGKMIKEGLIKGNETAIRKQLNLVARSRAKQSKDKILKMVLHDEGIPQRFMFYSPSQAQEWSDVYSKEDYKFGGEWDSKRNMYGFLCKEGYLYRTFWRAMKKWVETGKKSYVISHMGNPTKKANFDSKRENFQLELDFMKGVLKQIGVEVDFLIHEGSLPQDMDKDVWSKLIKPKK